MGKLVSGPQLRIKISPQALEHMEMEKTVTNTVAPSVTNPKQRKFPKRIPEPLPISDNPVQKAQPPPPPPSPQPSPEPPATTQSPILPSPDPIFQELPPAPAPVPSPVLPQAVPAVPGNQENTENCFSR